MTGFSSINSGMLGIGAHFVPKILSKIFPEQEDGYVGSFVRTSMRLAFDDTITELGGRSHRITYIAFPDNLGISTSLIHFFLLRKKRTLTLDEIIPLMSVFITAIASIHYFRELSFRILAPASRDLLPEGIGYRVSRIFRYLGPSDLKANDFR